MTLEETQMLDEIEALRKDAERLQGMLDEIEALRKDAERLHGMLERCTFEYHNGTTQLIGPKISGTFEQYSKYIDAAIRDEK